MKYVAAYLMAKLAGNESPSAGDVKKILESVGAEVENERIELLFSLIKDHDLADLIASGREMMAALSSTGGGGGAVVPAAETASPATETASPATEVVAGEGKKKEEVAEEEDDDMMMNLFD